MKNELLALIDSALTDIHPMALAGMEPAQSIERQLVWCREFASSGKQGPIPGPFSMGLIATREFDMYGDQPELASLINRIQRFVEAELPRI